MNRSVRFARVAAALVVALATTATTLTIAEAQSRGAAPAKGAKPRSTAPAKKPVKADAGAPAAPPAPEPSPAAPAPSPSVATQSTVDGGAVETRTLDGGAKVFKFGEIEIEGRLKSPQLVYFLRRVRAEFAAGDLGHRSFMRELSETRHEPSF